MKLPSFPCNPSSGRKKKFVVRVLTSVHVLAIYLSILMLSLSLSLSLCYNRTLLNGVCTWLCMLGCVYVCVNEECHEGRGATIEIVLNLLIAILLGINVGLHLLEELFLLLLYKEGIYKYYWDCILRFFFI